MDTDKQWFEKDEFWETWGRWIFNPVRITMAKEEIDRVLELSKITPGARVLDLGCGVGRHSLELARRGFKVTGVDRTDFYLKQARDKAAEEKLEVEFVHGDMRDFKRPGTFDAAINLFTAFGYFKDQNDDLKVMKNVCASLKPGGVFILDMHGKETMAKIFQKRIWNEVEGVIVLQEHTITQDWSWMQNRWIMLKGNERFENTVEHRLYAGTELAALFVKGGFSRADLFGDFEGHPYDETARRLVVVGHN